MDATPPAVGQVLLRDGRLRLEFDEPIQGDELRDAVGDGRLKLEELFPDGTAEPVPVVIEQEAPFVIPPLEPQGLTARTEGVGEREETPEASGRSAALLDRLGELAGATAGVRSTEPLASDQSIHYRRILIRPTQPLEEGSQVRLTVAAEVVQDRFQNPASEGIDETFAWVGTGTHVVADQAPPEVRAVRLRSNRLEVEFSEEPDLTTLSAISVEAPEPPAWVLKDDSVTVTTEEPLPSGERQLTIGTGLADLSGGNLTVPFAVTVGVPATLADVAVFEAEESGVVDFSSVGNRYGFHGRPVDPETGLIFFRNRYYSPELGRFITADPLGYVDGPSMYGFASNSPVNYTDPLGLSSADIRLRQRDERLLNPETRDAELDSRHESQEALATVLANPYVQGGFQVAGGCTEAFLGGLAIWTGVGTAPGAVALAHGTDLCGTGITTLVTGETQETLFYQGATATLERVGFDEGQARMGATVLDLGVGFYGVVGAGRAVQRGSQASVAAPATEEGTVRVLGRNVRVPYRSERLSVGVWGWTDKYGNITLKRGLPGRFLEETLRHESVHRFFSPRSGPLLELRANFGQAATRHSHFTRFLEEAIAETFATRSLRKGLRFPFEMEPPVSASRVFLEGAGYVGGTSAAAYGAYKSNHEE